MVKTPCFHCRGQKFPGWGARFLPVTGHSQKKKKKNRYILTLEEKFLLGKEGEERMEKEKFHLYF